MKRKLASFQKIKDIKPHLKADRLELAYVNGWQVVVPKGLYSIGEIIVFFEIDSFIPQYNFLNYLKNNYIDLNGYQGYRILSTELRGELSQGLIVKASSFGFGLIDESRIGEDLTERLFIKNYQVIVQENHIDGLIPNPHFIVKRDMDRLQNIVHEWEEYSKYKYYVTEKLDGQRITIWYDSYNGVTNIGSREYLITDDSHPFMDIVNDLNLYNLMSNTNKDIAVSGELIGPNIRGNSYKLDHYEFKVFFIYDYKLGRRWSFKDMTEFCYNNGLDYVPLLYMNYLLPYNPHDLLALANAPSKLNHNVSREGLVFWSLDSDCGFKVISNSYLLNNE